MNKLQIFNDLNVHAAYSKERIALAKKIAKGVKLVQGDVLDTPCWVWQGGTSGNGRGGGYGRMSWDGQTVCVHRVAYSLVHGYVVTKKQIDHLCKNRACCNPAHLEKVTHKKNQRRRRKNK